MRNSLVVVRPVNERPVPAERHSTISISGTSVVQVLSDADLENSVRDLDEIVVGHRDWLVVDLARVRSATRVTCNALVTAMDLLSPDRFCVVVPPCSSWLGALLPRRVHRVTFRSVGDALQMVVFATEGLDAGWMGLRLAVSPVGPNAPRSSLARLPSNETPLVEIAG
jgi:hypothetical protein